MWRNKRQCHSSTDLTSTGRLKKQDSRKDSLYHCDNCGTDLTNTLHIKCAVCSDFDLCLDCYRVGVQFGGHSNDHSYRVVDDLSFPIYHPAWGVDEELLLLEAVETYGLGNWAKVSEHVGRAEEACKEHYFSVYIDTDTFPIPRVSSELRGVDIGKIIEERRALGSKSMQRGRAKGKASALCEVSDDDEDSTLVFKSEPVEESAVNGAGGKKHHSDTSPSPTKLAKEAKIEPDRGQSTFGLRVEAGAATPTIGQGGKSPAGGSEHIVNAAETVNTGYSIKRNEFDPEWDFEAESIISELDFRDDDSPEDTARKLQLIKIYNRRLDERLRRRAFVLERGLVNVKGRQGFDKRRGAGEREMVGKLRVFARYLAQDDFEALADGLSVEGRLRARIAELQNYRSMGLRTFQQVDSWEATEGKKRKEPSLPSHCQNSKSRLQRTPLDDAAMQAQLAGPAEEPHAALLLGHMRTTLTDGRGPNGLSHWRSQRGVALDITSLPDAVPLTGPERALCATERYLPAQLLAIKAAAAEIKAKTGKLEKQDMLSLPFKVDPQRMIRLWELFTSQPSEK